MPSARSALVIGVAELASEASASAPVASRIEACNGSLSIVDGPSKAVGPPDPGKRNTALLLRLMQGRQGLTPINLKLSVNGKGACTTSTSVATQKPNPVGSSR